MKEYTHQQWLDELKSRFGENIMDWAFKCPACSKVSTIKEFIMPEQKYMIPTKTA